VSPQGSVLGPLLSITQPPPPKKNLGALIFGPVPGVIWGADSENGIG